MHLGLTAEYTHTDESQGLFRLFCRMGALCLTLRVAGHELCQELNELTPAPRLLKAEWF